VLPEDVQAVTASVVAHRLLPREESGPRTPREIGEHVLESVPIP
jgi:hypothetical protein